MRNDSHKWDRPFLPGALLVGDGVEISSLPFERLYLVSGMRVREQTSLPIVGWPDPAPAGAYAISLRRDRVLEVDGGPRIDGWEEADGLAISNVTDGYHAFLVEGTQALEFLKKGAELSLAEPSLSAARPMFGLPAILYRLADARYVLMFTRAHADAAWLALNSCLGHQQTS